MLADSGAALLVGSAGAVEGLVDPPPLLELDTAPTSQEDATRAGVRSDPADLAFIYYTSGSTGSPRGVELDHRGIVNEARWTRREIGVEAGDRSTWMSSPAFAISRWELWSYLLAGAEVHVVDDLTVSDPERLQRLLLEREIAVTFAITWLAERLFALPWPRRVPLRTLITGGEAVKVWPPAELAFEVVVSYGITEVSSVRLVSWPNRGGRTGSGPPPIGRPIDGTRPYVLDGRGEPVAPGAIGELYIGGTGLARGYRGLPALTAERFVPDPFGGEPGARMYRTGDLVRQLANGELAFVGRADNQTKLRGVRFEPEEIEAVLAEHPEVQRAAVAVLPGAAGADRLAAFIVPADHPGPDPRALRGWLADRLAVPLVPSLLRMVASLPMSANGKLDRRALATIDAASARRPYRPPRTAAETAVAEAWAELAGISGAGLDDDFFELGGESLAATRVLAVLANRWRVALALKDFVRDPTVAGLARQLESGAPLDPPGGPRPDPVAELSDEEVEALIQAVGEGPGERGGG